MLFALFSIFPVFHSILQFLFISLKHNIDIYIIHSLVWNNIIQTFAYMYTNWATTKMIYIPTHYKYQARSITVLPIHNYNSTAIYCIHKTYVSVHVKHIYVIDCLVSRLSIVIYKILCDFSRSEYINQNGIMYNRNK